MEDIKIKKSDEVGKKFKIICGNCKNETNHTILSAITVDGRIEDVYDEDNVHVINWNEEYQVIQCNGCDKIAFRRLSSNSEDVDHNGYIEDEDIFPNPESERDTIKDSLLLPAKLEKIYSETVKSLNKNLQVLTGIGIRAIIETICKEKKASGTNLFEKINDLQKQNALTQEGTEILHKLRVLGNNSAHEVKPHSNVQLGLALDVIDNLLTSVYILPHHAKYTLD